MADNTYRVEYSATGRAKCKDVKCKTLIAKGSLRIAKESPVPETFGGGGESTMTSWYHSSCAFRALKRAKPETKRIDNLEALAGFEMLKKEDKGFLRKLVHGEELWEPSGPPIDQAGMDSKSKSKKSVANGKLVFEGRSFCLSGKFERTQGELVGAIEANGGRIEKTVTKTVDFLVSATRDAKSSKYVAAKNRHVPIVNEAYLFDCLKVGALKQDSPYRWDTLKEHDSVQTETNSSRKRKLTASHPKSEAGGGGDWSTPCWEWCDENGKWNKYDQETLNRILQAEKQGEKLLRYTLYSNNQTYDFHFGAHYQENVETSVQRKMRRNPPLPNFNSSPKKQKVANSLSGETQGKEDLASIKSGTAKMKKIIRKGKAPVDEHCGLSESCHVLEEGDTVYDCMLNQTNIGQNNNKYYSIQVLESDTRSEYYCWQRWGRVGKINGTNLDSCGSDKEKAKSILQHKFQSKTKNAWTNRLNFIPHKGKYTLMEMDYGDDMEDTDIAEANENGMAPPKNTPSALDEPIQELVKLIFDKKMMTQQMVEIGYDANKLPLGKLTRKHILNGLKVLQSIADVLDGKGKRSLTELSSEFYTLIPHDFGMRRPVVINNKAVLKKKLEMVEALADIELATKLMKGSRASEQEKNVLDMHYDNLNCDISIASQPESNMIKKYVAQTHGKTHTTYKLNVEQVYAVDRQGEKDRYKEFQSLPNRQLLWHGSRLSNFVGILSTGLRIAPPEAPVTGYMFGKGLYFADMSSKSANYCNASRSNPKGLLILAEVACGDMELKYKHDYEAANLPHGKHSTKGVGVTSPDISQTVTLKNGTMVPLGPGIEDEALKGETVLLYNEYIVYNVSQVKIKYLVKVDFDFEVSEEDDEDW